MRVTRILHHSVNVEGRLTECVAFYQRLALADLPRPYLPGIDGHWFGTGYAQVHLVDAPGGRDGDSPGRSARLFRYGRPRRRHRRAGARRRSLSPC